MTIDEKRHAMIVECNNRSFCRESNCPLWKEDVLTCDFDDDAFVEKYYPKLCGKVNTNNVDHPSHYNANGAMECIDEMVLIFGKEATMHFCLLNAWKYRYRANAKNGQEDWDKANWYITKYKELKEECADESNYEDS